MSTAGPAAQPRTILGKYDEEAGAAMQLDEAGALNAAKLAQQEEVRRRLKASLSGLPGGAKEQSASTVLGTQADFLSPEEVVQFAAPKKLRKKKKLRERVDMTDLEAAIAAEGALPGDELGSRRSAQETAATARCASKLRSSALACVAAEPCPAPVACSREKEDLAASRFEAAKSKAAAASAAAFGAGVAGLSTGAEDEGDGDEADAELQAALQRARRAALVRAPDVPTSS